MIEMKRILVPVDGSKSSEKAIDKAITLASLCHAQLDFIYVSHLPPEADRKAAEILWLPESVVGSVKKMSKEILEHAVRKIPEHIKYQTYLKNGIAAEVIAEFAEENQSDLIVIAARGLGRIEGYLLGSVSQYLLENVKCPVLVLK